MRGGSVPVGAKLACVVPGIWLLISTYVLVRLATSSDPRIQSIGTLEAFAYLLVQIALVIVAISLLLRRIDQAIYPVGALLLLQVWLLYGAFQRDQIYPSDLAIPGVLLANYALTTLYLVRMRKRKK